MSKDSVKKSKRYPKLQEGDYYFNEDGWMVFTQQYHLRRGYCCENGCLHCPYGYKKYEKVNEKKDKI
ncbi:MAG: DUF5522 domain-containing protein [Flammeovirgaceae bacterium]